MNEKNIVGLIGFFLALIATWAVLAWLQRRALRRAELAKLKKEQEDRDAVSWAHIQYPDAESIKMGEDGVLRVSLREKKPSGIGLSEFIRTQDRFDALREQERADRHAAERRKRARPVVAPNARRHEPEAAPSTIPVPWEDAAWVGAWKKQDPEPAPPPEPYFLSGEGGSYGGGGASGSWDSAPSPSPAPSDSYSSPPSPSD